MRQRLLFSLRSLIDGVGHLFHIRHGYLAPAETADEVQHRRLLAWRRVEHVADLACQHASEIWRAERVVAIDDPNRRKPPQGLRQFFSRKRPEPAHTHKTEFLP